MYVRVYVCMCVCMSVYAHTILAVRAIKSVTKDTVVLKGVFLKIVLFEISNIFYSPRQGRPSLVDAYSACNVSYTFRYMFAYA